MAKTRKGSIVKRDGKIYARVQFTDDSGKRRDFWRKAATDAVLEEVQAWQTRPLDAVYPILYLDALVVKVKENSRVINKSVYLVIGVNLQGLKKVLGIWIAETEGAKFWLSIVTELQTRGVEDVFIACVDGLKGFPEAIESVYPRTQVQLCLV